MLEIRRHFIKPTSIININIFREKLGDNKNIE